MPIFVRFFGCRYPIFEYYKVPIQYMSNECQIQLFFPLTLYGKIHLYLMDRTSVKCVIKFLFCFFGFHLNSMKIGENVVVYVYKTSLTFIEFE